MRTIITGLRLVLVRSVVQLFSIRTAGISTDITSASFTVSNVRSCVLMYRALSHSHIQYYETWLSSGFSEKSRTIDMSIGFHKAGHVKWLLWLGGLLRQLLSCREKFLKFSVKNLKNFSHQLEKIITLRKLEFFSRSKDINIYPSKLSQNSELCRFSIFVATHVLST